MESPVPFMQLDAFSPAPCSGNPAAVLLLRGPMDNEADYLRISAENNLSETAFVWPRRDATATADGSESVGVGKSLDFAIRWFTPTVEVNLCGHATLAAAAALYLQGAVPRSSGIRFHSVSKGILEAALVDKSEKGSGDDEKVGLGGGRGGGGGDDRVGSGWEAPPPKSPLVVTLSFPAAGSVLLPAVGDAGAPAFLAPLLAAAFPSTTPGGDEMRKAVSEVWHSEATSKVIVVLNPVAEQVFRNFQPDVRAMHVLEGTGGDTGVKGLSVTMAGDHLSGRKVDFVSRYFTPWNGIDEDPVNGSSHTALVPLWARKLGKNKLSAEMLSKRGGVLDLEFKPDDDRVLLGGPCSLVIQGKFHLP